MIQSRYRYIFLAVVIVLAVHFLLNLQSSASSAFNRILDLFQSANGRGQEQSPTINRDTHAYEPSTTFQNHTITTESSIHRRANATFVVLARNSEVDHAVRSVREMEDRFNRKFRYPYVFLNEEPFSEEFKKRISVLTDAPIEFGLISPDHWYQPDWIDQRKASDARIVMKAQNIIYGGSLSYRNMCRFNSGFFFKHELMQKYRWYWRIEPDVHFYCDVDYDPFVFMENNDKVYGFTITMHEFQKTIPSLWRHVRDFTKLHPEYVAPDNAMAFLSDDYGWTYNGCHFWSNFEIADMDFWRAPAYQAFFDYLDSKGGFYYERWGDAPVHSIGVGLFARRDQIHFFDSMGYEHAPCTHCPRREEDRVRGKCSCSPDLSFDYNGYSCIRQWDRLMER